MTDSFDDDEKPDGNVIVFPGGKTLSPQQIGAGYVVGPSGNVPVIDVVDAREIRRELRERESYVSGQELVRAIEDKAPVADIIDEVLKEIAEELSHLKYERRKAAADGKNTANYTVSRIASLRSLADILQKRMENARQERLDFSSPQFKKVLHLWMTYWYDSMVQAGLNEGTVDSVFKIVESNMKDWEKKVSDHVG